MTRWGGDEVTDATHDFISLSHVGTGTTMSDLLRHTSGESLDRATVHLDPARRGDAVPPELFGKFGEHLYTPRNVRNVLEAQVLYNPSFAAWEFLDHQYDADGGRGGISDPEEIDDRIETYVDTQGLPDAERLQEAYRDGTALWWFPYGQSDAARDAVRTSPDVGTADDRAQRFEVGADEGRRASESSTSGHRGLAQWCHLPVHRTIGYEGTVTIRAAEETPVRFAVHEVGPDGDLGAVLGETTVTATREDRTRSMSLDLPTDVAATDTDGSDDAGEPDRLFGFSVTTPAADVNVVVDRVLLRPDDHVHTADPEIVARLRELDVSLLRWPGGNFASGYHWEDAIGPVEERPARPNPAWDGVETNHFGTDEFLELCEAVDCEPMICLNAGDGTPEEAARWVEYCNGDPEETEMGRLRAEHGHPEPYGVPYWEVGNELYGSWQITWTTPDGNADRFERFREAILSVDEDVEIFACGNRLTDWNDPLVDSLDDGDWLTDHVLLECHADPTTDPVELFNAHTGFAATLGEQYRDVADQCREAGLDDVRQAITELQLFTRFDEPDDSNDGEGMAATGSGGLSRETLPTNKTITEAVFDATIINECVRSETVEMVTHSGVGNHGGGLRKSQGRVWADPCFYGQKLNAALAGGTPIGIDLTCGTFSTATRWGTDTTPWFGELPPVADHPVVDAVAVTDAAEHDLVVTLVHCDAGASEIEVTVDAGDLLAGVDSVTVDTLTAETMHASNTLADPERVTPTTDSVPVDDGTVTVSLPPYSLVRLTVADA